MTRRSLAVGSALILCLALSVGAEPPSPGYTLFAPISLTSTFLIDLSGRVVHEWKSDAPAGNAVYLLPNGHLLRTESVSPPPEGRTFAHGGAGGRVRELAPDGRVVWEFTLSTPERRLHHDVEPLPNGNVLVIAWEVRTRAEAIAVGRDASLLPDGEVWPDAIFEVRPVRPVGGEIVWEWHVWDHLVQDRDPGKPNYGSVAAHPERVNVNYAAANGAADWCHTNSVAYNADLDQIALSIREWNEVWLIDHSTTTAEAAGSTGGRWGRGGDLLYRVGNPAAYGAGTERDQTLFGQHDAQWIAADRPGAGNLLVFNNGGGKVGPARSSVDEIAWPAADLGVGDSSLTTPADLVWRYAATGFASSYISGAERLPNGNTLICEGDEGRLFEVSVAGDVVWEYVNPFSAPGSREPRNEVFKARRYSPDDPAILTLFAALGTTSP